MGSLQPPTLTTQVARAGRAVIGDLNVTGTITAGAIDAPVDATDIEADTLTVSGHSSLNTLDVGGAATLASLDVGADLDVQGDVTVTGTVDASPPTLGTHLTTLNYVERRPEVTRVTISGGSIPNTSAYTMPFDTVQWDPNGNWDPVAFQYTVPKTGFYLISLSIRAPLPSGYLRSYLQGGTDFAYGTEVGAVTGGSTTTTLTTVFGLGAGDQFTVSAFQNSGAPVAPQPGYRFTFLSIAYLGRIEAI